MGLNSALERLVFFLWMSGMWAELTDKCINDDYEFDRIFSVPGDVAMLNSTLLNPKVLNLTADPYNITWYNKKTGQEMRNQTGQILVLRETLWFLNTTLEDAGEYMMKLQTSFKDCMQSMWLMVDLPVAGECGRPQKFPHVFTYSISGTLNCPLGDYINKLESYNITPSIKWYKGCEPIQDGSDGYAYRDRTILQIYKVGTENKDNYTCTLTFTLGGVTGSVSETTEATITDVYSFIPRVLEPANEAVKAEKGSSLTRKCLVFVQGTKNPSAGLTWFVRNNSISNQSARISSPEQRKWNQDKPERGVWLERLLIISELRAEDFNINYVCRVDSSRGIFRRYFTLLPADPNIVVTIGFIFGGVTVFFIISVTIYYVFKIDIILCLRRAFPLFYKNKDKKLYDAYVIYPQPDVYGFNEEVENFVLHTLPEVLEKACGYKLFIGGRDCLPGQAIMDSVDENIQASRCVLLLYTASTFIDQTTSRNENISECSDGGDNIESTRQQLEHVAAMHRALLEGSVKVVLVELEEITPVQLALFPESVRHLRKKQGAVCWWKNLQTRQTWRTCVRRREDEENHGKDSQLSPSLSPSSRFWKEIRFQMPVRAKRVLYPEKTALLNL